MNLLSDPWILTTSGRVSVNMALQNASKVQLTGNGKSIVCILRLLLSACYVGGETSAKLLEHGVSPRTLESLNFASSRFELDSGYWICPDLPGKTDSLSRLISAAPTNRNPVFTYHARDDRFLIVPAWQLAQLTLEYQFFGLVAGNSSLGYRYRSPGSTAAIGVAIGTNLLETLALNLVFDPEPAVASWQVPNPTSSDFRNQSCPTSKSIAQRYTWIAQGMRFDHGGVVTARGFQRQINGDPMAGVQETKNGSTYLRLVAGSPYLTACALHEGKGIHCPTLAHAATLGIPYSVLVVAQRNENSASINLLESTEGVFPVELLDTALAASVELFYLRLTNPIKREKSSDFDRQLKQLPSLEIAEVFVSYVQDWIVEQLSPQIDLIEILSATLRDTGNQAHFEFYASVLKGAIMDAFFDYLHRLRPDQCKVIKYAWKQNLISIERDFPKLIAWTGQHRIARLTSAGVYATHPKIGTNSLIALIRGHLPEAEFLKTLDHDLEYVGMAIRRWMKWLPIEAALDHKRLHADFLSWHSPSQFVQHRWKREYYRHKETESEAHHH